MGRSPTDDDGKISRGCHTGIRLDSNRTYRFFRQHMKPKKGIGTCDTPLFNGQSRTFRNFLCGLEEKPHGSFQLILHTFENFGGSQQHGYVHVMPTGMHFSGEFGCI